MYRLFLSNNIQEIDRLSPYSQSIRRIKEEVLYNYSDIKEYYKQIAHYIPNDHILMVLVNKIKEYPGYNEDLYRVIERNLQSITTMLGITSHVNPGDIHDKAFYTKQCTIVTCEYYNYYDIENIPYQDIRPVRVLNHELYDSSLNLPDIHNHIKHNGISVVGIDIPALAVMYSKWFILNNKKTIEEQEKTSFFIGRYILPNMIPEQHDIAIRNRLIAMNNGIEVPINHKTVHNEVDYTRDLIIALNSIIMKINTNTKHYTIDLYKIPMVFSNNMLESVSQNFTGLFIYSYWAVLLIYTDWLYFVKVCLTSDKSYNSKFYNKFRDIDKYIKSSNTLRFMDSEIENYYLIRYNELKEKWYRR